MTAPYSLTTTIAGTFTLEQGSQVVTIGNAFNFYNGTPPPIEGVNWSGFSTHDYTTGLYVLHGTLKVQQGGNSYTKIYDITPPTKSDPLVTSEAGLEAAQAAYDPAVPIGVHRTMEDAGHKFADTPFDDWVDGGAGSDHIHLTAGEDVAHGGDGDDLIEANGVGRSLLHGGTGDDHLVVTSTSLYANLLGGDGHDLIEAYAPASMINGGAGNDHVVLDPSAAGSVITDAEGSNRLEVEMVAGAPLGFERLPYGDALYILLGGGETYDRARDVVWVDFFANPDNQVNGLTTAEVADLATTVQPAVPPPAAEQMPSIVDSLF